MSLHFSFIFNFKVKQIENIKKNQFNLTDSQRNLILLTYCPSTIFTYSDCTHTCLLRLDCTHTHILKNTINTNSFNNLLVTPKNMKS